MSEEHPRTRGEERGTTLFLALGLVIGLTFLVVTPPFQAPDEAAHFLRAYALSEGQLLPVIREGHAGAVLPESLLTYIDQSTETAPSSTGGRLRPAALREARRLPLDPEKRRFLHFSNTAVYSPLVYAPQALGIACGRVLGAGPGGLLILGRLANLLASIACIAYAVSLFPSRPLLLVALSLAPMATFLRSSVSADVPTFSIAAVFLAFLLREFREREARHTLGLPLAALGLCLTKLPYAVLCMTALALILTRKRGHRRLGVVVLLCALAGGIAGSAFALRVTPELSPDPSVNKSEQLAHTLAEPIQVARVLLSDLFLHGPRYAAEFIGRLGWLDVELPWPILAAYSLLLFLLACTGPDSGPPDLPAQRVLLIVAGLACTFVVLFSQYVVWTPVGAAEVLGTQGRHFYPPVLFLAWGCLPSRGALRRLDRLRPAMVVAMVIVAHIAAILRVHSRYFAP